MPFHDSNAMPEQLDRLIPNPLDRKSEPLVTRASIVAVATALLGLLVSFGLPITEEQQVALLGFVGVVSPFAVAFWARRKVTPVKPQHRGEVGGIDTGTAVLIAVLVVLVLVVVGVLR